MRVIRRRKPFAGHTDPAGYRRPTAPRLWPFGMDPAKEWKDGRPPVYKTAAKKRIRLK